VAGMFELQDNTAFKDHLCDFLVQTKSFSSQDNADLFADEAAAAREVCLPAWPVPWSLSFSLAYTLFSHSASHKTPALCARSIQSSSHTHKAEAMYTFFFVHIASALRV